MLKLPVCVVGSHGLSAVGSVVPEHLENLARFSCVFEPGLHGFTCVGC